MLGFCFTTSGGSPAIFSSNAGEDVDPEQPQETFYFITSESEILQGSDGNTIEVNH